MRQVQVRVVPAVRVAGFAVLLGLVALHQRFYYVLGTALAEGKGYRLLNEPGDIEANQYPPLLALVIAFHQ